jgi:hypothetical protein
LAERASDQLLNSIAESHRTVWEFFVIAYVADTRWQRPATPFTAAMLSKALEGADHTEHDQNFAARNTQFELYVASLLAMGGAEVRLGEPDLRILYRGVDVGIAVKRMSSVNVNTLEKRLLEGVDQILRSTSEGLVALNIDVHFRNEALPDDKSLRDRIYDAAVKRVYDIVDKREDRLDKIVGFLVFGFLAAWDLSARPPRFDNSYPMSRQLFLSGSTEDEHLQEFWNTLFDRMDRELLYLRTGKL